MTRKTGNKWSTKECARCLQPHSGYSGKLDENGIEYVVCGGTNKRMDVDYSKMHKNILRNLAYPTNWEKEN